MDTLYESILSLCNERGVTGGKMCTDIGISKSTLTSLKKGRRNGISIDTAQKIADYFGVPVDRVLSGGAKSQPDDPGIKKEPAAPSGDELLDAQLIHRLCSLTPEELQIVDAFVQGLLAKR